ncbi:MAG: hypothetical protein GX945_08985 [Lentisphaerae bacterium]|nr:hypothetical protein [Lentisphaerota bacterium]
MEELIYFLLMVGVILSARSRMKKEQEQRPTRHDDEAPPDLPPLVIRRAPQRPTLPPRAGQQSLPQLFDELLGVERDEDDEQELPMSSPDAAPASSESLPVPLPLPPPLPVSPAPTQPMIRVSGAAAVPPERRRYVEDTGDKASPPVAAASMPASLTPAELLGQNLATAFPETTQQVHTLRPGGRAAPIPVRVGGRSGLRRAVIMAEILQRPRAYDL